VPMRKKQKHFRERPVRIYTWDDGSMTDGAVFENIKKITILFI